ncbi:MAG: PQQ-binding-like beta-propeller repeat protein [Planctomycetes bacterium]|nr:PQQ-binding-like beta-propeller repeat protein [Planctomycetota bacterium]
MKYQLTVIGKEGLSVYPIEKERVIVGRSSKADLQIKDRFISRKQLIIECSNGFCSLVSLSRKNQTLLNGDPVKSNCPYPLKEGDKIKLGEIILAFAPSSDEAKEEPEAEAPAKEIAAPKELSVPKITFEALAPNPVFFKSYYGIGEGVSAAGALVMVHPSYFPDIHKEIKQLIRRMLSSFLFWIASLVIHVFAIGLLIFFHTMPKPELHAGPVGIRFVSDRVEAPQALEASSNMESLLQSLLNETKITANDSILQETESKSLEADQDGEEESLGDVANSLDMERTEYVKEFNSFLPLVGLNKKLPGAKGKSSPLVSSVLLTGKRALTNGQKVLKIKWEYRFLATHGVQLYKPSGWGHGDQSVQTAPWLISSPAVIAGKGLMDIVSGTEEGSGEFSRGNANTSSAGRYVCVTKNGKHKWQYETNNNAGRASANIINYNGATEIVGGSTSGWMVHLFKDNGQRIWRFESESKANFIASPVAVDTNDAIEGPEIIALDLSGNLYCISHKGNKIWSKYVSAPPAIATPLAYDVDNDGDLEIITAGNNKNNSLIQCLDGKTGNTEWEGNILRDTKQSGWGFVQVSSPAVIPHNVNPIIVIGIGDKLYAFNGRNGKVLWTAETSGFIYSSPAVGDCDGDNIMEVIFGSLDGKIYCLDSRNGNAKWVFQTKGRVYSSPALATKDRVGSYQSEWAMFRNSSGRTGYYDKKSESGLDVFIGSDDGSLYALDGKEGICVDRIEIKFSNLTVAGSNHGPLKFVSSPIVADIDGDRKLDILFTLVDKMVCVMDNRK